MSSTIGKKLQSSSNYTQLHVIKLFCKKTLHFMGDGGTMNVNFKLFNREEREVVQALKLNAANIFGYYFSRSFYYSFGYFCCKQFHMRDLVSPCFL